MTMEKEKEKEKKNVKTNEKEKEKKTKEKEMVKHTRPMAVNHSLPPNQDRGRSPLKVRINNNIMIKIGPKTIGGQTVMPPRTNKAGAKTMSGPHTGPHNTGPQTVAGHHTTLICSPSPTQNASSPGWNPGTPLMFAKILSM